MKPLTKKSTLGKSGIPNRETFWVLDSSKVQQFQDCPRGFFYSQILGWRSDTPNIHLVFGSAWHEAMEHMLMHGRGQDVIMEAYDRFMNIYTEKFNDDPYVEEHYAKNPANALVALAGWANSFDYDPDNTLYTEVAGIAPISEDRIIHFKMDTIRKQPPHHQDAGKIYSLEHKTTSRKTQSWMDKWTYKFQVGCYIHALMYWIGDPKNVDGLTINGSIFRKNNQEHLRIPIRKSQNQMLEWLHEANYWFDRYEEEMERLMATSPSDKVMVAFPRNTESCSKFGCKFPGICNARPNPLRDMTCPNGYKEDFWDPRDRNKKAKHTLDLTKDTPEIEEQ